VGIFRMTTRSSVVATTLRRRKMEGKAQRAAALLLLSGERNLRVAPAVDHLEGRSDVLLRPLE
jgi:hypothetical protein